MTHGDPAPGATPVPVPSPPPSAPADRSDARWMVALLVAAAALLLLQLGVRDLWTHERRNAAICLEMMRSGDYLHPRLYGEPYYDKPLLMYWLMIGFGRLLGGLGELALRLPSALAGLVAVAGTVRLGRTLLGREAGRWAGWILLSTFFFVYWSRVAGPDLMNLAGSVAAVAWYFERRDRPGFLSYAVFFLILSVTCLVKGLVGAVIPLLVLAPDLLAGGRWRAHLRLSLLPAAVPAAAVYFVPFLLSNLAGGGGEGESGLALVFRENVVRFFRPFDHMKEPVYAYLKFFPVLFLPWSLLLPVVIWNLVRRWRTLGPSARWPAWACLLVFLFFTASLSRRSYYILPILPFAALMVAEWVAAEDPARRVRRRVAAGLAGVLVAGMAVWLVGVQPWLESPRALRAMGAEVQAEAERRAPWPAWDLALWGGPEQAVFYLAPKARAVQLDKTRPESLAAHLRDHPRTIVVATEDCLEAVRALVPRAVVVRQPGPSTAADRLCDRWAPHPRIVAVLPD